MVTIHKYNGTDTDNVGKATLGIIDRQQTIPKTPYCQVHFSGEPIVLRCHIKIQYHFTNNSKCMFLLISKRTCEDIGNICITKLSLVIHQSMPPNRSDVAVIKKFSCHHMHKDSFQGYKNAAAVTVLNFHT